MKIWIPYIKAETGSDVSTEQLARGFERVGCKVVLQPFHPNFEFSPWLLKHASPPPDTDLTITNTWNGFAFARPGLKMITVERLFVLDPALKPYKSPLQHIYHQTLIRRFVSLSAKYADAVVAVSRYTSRAFASELKTQEPHIILNAVDTTYFTPKNTQKPPVHNRPIRLLYVGNLSRRKGSDLLAPIMERLGERFQLYYTTGLKPTKISNSHPNMHSLGRLTQTQVRDEYRAADLLLFPSRGEGLARAVMESLACGTPVVAANVSSLPEAITPDVGRLCPVDDVDAFAAAIRELTINDDRLDQLRRASRTRSTEKFDLMRMVYQYLSLFESKLRE